MRDYSKPCNYLCMAALLCTASMGLVAGQLDGQNWISNLDGDLSNDDTTPMFQGDIYGLDLHSAKAAVQELPGTSSGQTQYRHSILPHHWRVWPAKVVPYTLAEQYSQEQRSVIERAIQVFHEKTCLRFVPRTSERDYVDIRARRGCFSALGRIGGAQPLSLDKNCLRSTGVVVHELMHAIGFLHEHARPDRDKYVEIQWENVHPQHMDDFSILPGTQTLDLPYDLNSVMHYSQYEFSRNGRKTIIPVSAGVNIGRQKLITALDLQKINKFYQCSDSEIGTRDNNRPEGQVQLPQVVTEPPPSGSQTTQSCTDLRDDCAALQAVDYCTLVRPFMQIYCRRTCGFCAKNEHEAATAGAQMAARKKAESSCVDATIFCKAWKPFCRISYTEYMQQYCKETCELC